MERPDEKRPLIPAASRSRSTASLPPPVTVYQDTPRPWYDNPYYLAFACLLFIGFVLAQAFTTNERSDNTDTVFPAVATAAIASYNITYLSVPGFFKQDRYSANETKIGPAPARFGLVDSKGKYWTKFVHTIDKLNEQAGPYVAYKVLYLSRHGEGYHNVGMDYYGEDEWDRKWGRKNGNGSMTWGPDAELTPKGVQQAIRVHELWQKEMDSGGGIPLPTKLYVSPMSRALNTLQITFASIVDSPPPLVIEGLRDTYGLRTPDLRHNKTWIHQTYPAVEFEDGFTEHDELWTKDSRETSEHTQLRVQKVLDNILKSNDTYMAVVAHSNILEAVFKLTRHHNFDVPTGGAVPILIKVMTNRL